MVLAAALSACRREGADEAALVVGRQRVVFAERPGRTPSQYSVDAPLMGNGSLGVAMGGGGDSLTFYLSRNDFWRLRSAHDEAYPALLGRLEVSLPGLAGGSYRVEQRLWDATTRGHFARGGRCVECQALVAAGEDVLIVRLESVGTDTVAGRARLVLPGRDEVPGLPEVRESGRREGGVMYIVRSFADSVDIPTRAAAALRVEGSADGSFTLRPGRPLTLVCTTGSNFKAPDCLSDVVGRASDMGGRRLRRVLREHRRWWADYWRQSYVCLPDSAVERQYYLSLYGMASCSRDADFPPGLFGSWITREIPAWCGDYHLNYNYQAPFYGLYSSNRLAQAEPYAAPLLAAIPRGEYYSQAVAGVPGGIMLPVGIGPLGIETTRWSARMEAAHADWRLGGNIECGGMFWGQKSNAAYAVGNLSMHFYRTWDAAFARRVYPFVRGVAIFWEGYLRRQGDRYVILNDAIHEGTVGTMNPICSLGLVRMALQTACDMGELLGLDADRRAVWRGRMDSLSAFPTQERQGRTVFRYTEQGVDWWPDNTLGIQHIFPAGQVGLASDTALLRVARNTIDAMRRWSDFNGTNSFFPAAVRVGYPADSILVHLREYAGHTYPNGFQRDNPHGPENWGTVPCTVNEMLCMGHQGIVRLFPVWPRGLDARFCRLRVEGAFLVSAALHGGRVGEVTLLSEQGRPLALQNPWGEGAVVVSDSGGRPQTLRGAVLRLSTQPGHTYTFRPEQNPDNKTIKK